jgi:transcriptional regulator of acetoin/glycerol metabolism
MLLNAEDRLSRARIVLERRGLAAQDLLAPPIAASWTRCLEAGLDPQAPPPLPQADDALLAAAREQHAVLRRLALGEMGNLHHQIAGTNFMIAFAAPDGMLLDAITDPTFAAAARATGIRPGTLWSEASCGTNALGTVVATGQAIMVHGPEHFFRRYGALTCMAAPVMGPDGRLAGVLDASSDCRSRQQHTRALVSMAATQIENGLFRECHRRAVLVAFHSRAEYLHTLSAGLLALDPDGRILAANARACFLLQGLPARPGRHFDDVFEGGFATLVQASREGETQRLQDRVGSAYAARLENLRRARPLAVAALPTPDAPPPSFVVQDAAVAEAVRLAEAAALRRLPILIRGETGTGKEQLARHIHAACPRQGAFVPVNCAALPDSLVEAELFGHADGAFTGARRGGAPGLAVEADGGTLFLDEIGEMKPALQSVLLRLLDDWTVRPVGGGKPRRVAVQLVAATHVDLARAIAAGRFRADLYYRLAGIEVSLPPLGARTDLGALTERMLAELAPGWRIAPDALAGLRQLPWPGNLRQLRSWLVRATLDRPHGVIDATALARPGTPDQAASPPAGLRAGVRASIRAVHAETGANVSATARRLGISRNAVYRALAGSDRGAV